MKKTYPCLTIVLLMSLVVSTMAQIGPDGADDISKLAVEESGSLIHLDKPYYFAGEYLFYAFSNHQITTDSTIARIIFGKADEMVFSHYIRMDSHGGNGYISLPHTLISAVYHLHVIVFDQTSSKEITLANVSIPIYNPSELSKLDLNQVQPKYPKNDLFSGNKKITVELIPRTFQPRKKVLCQLEIDLADGESVDFYSIAIRDNFVYSNNRSTIFNYKTKPLDKTLQKIPVFGLERVSTDGELFNPLLFGIQPEKLVFDGALIDETSREFVLKLTPFIGKKPIIIADYKHDHFTVEITEKAPLYTPSVSLSVDSAILNHLKHFQEENKINHWFQILGQNINPEKIGNQVRTMKPGLIIDVDDFDIQGRVVTLFKEILSPLKFRQTKGGKYRAQMLYIRNEIKKFYTRDPLFIVNNRVTRDGDFIAQMPLQEIDFMHIFSNYDSIYTNFGAVGLGGIVLMEMKDQNYILPVEITLPSFSIQGLQQPIQYPIVQTPKTDIPQVGSMLYWDPKVEVNPTGKFEIEFYTNDIASEYVLELVAHPTRTGLPWKTLIPLKVHPKSIELK